MRKIINVSFCIVALFLINGCAANKVVIGMTREEVIKVMGNPISEVVDKGEDYMNYRYPDTILLSPNAIESHYYVRLVDGKVKDYGKTGE